MTVIELGPVPYTKSQRLRFMEGSLRDEWYQQYKDLLFDERDLSAAKGRVTHHFVEWLAAITLFHTTGYLSFYFKRKVKSNPRKRAILEHRVKHVPGLLELIDEKETKSPDLFLFREDDITDWWFCEVKGHADKLAPEQVRSFNQISSLLDHDAKAMRARNHVYVLSLKHVPDLSA